MRDKTMEKGEEVGFKSTETGQRAKGLVAKLDGLGYFTSPSLSFLFQTGTTHFTRVSVVVKSIVFANLDLNLRSGRYQLCDFMQVS